MELFFLGFIASFLSSLIAAFSGGGSSLVLLPILLLFAPGTYASLLTTTKISATTMTLISAKIHAFQLHLEKKLFLILIIFGLLGTALGTYLVQYQFNEELFKNLLAGVLLILATYLLFTKKLGEEKKFIATPVHALIWTALVSFFINILNGLFGGTGIFITLFLVIFLKFSFIQAIAYTMLSYVFINIAQTLYLVMTEPIHITLSLGALIGAIIGAALGTKLQYLKGNLWVKRAATMLMYILVLRMLIG